MSAASSSKIFWPQCDGQRSGYLVGWRVANFNTCVVSIVSDIEVEKLEEVLNSIRILFPNKVKHWPCGTPVVLGEYSVGGENENSVPDVPASVRRVNQQKRPTDKDIWIKMKQGSPSNLPYLREIYCYGKEYVPSMSQIILYHQRSPRHYFCATPINLDVLSYGNWKDEDKVNPFSRGKECELDDSLEVVNCAAECEALIREAIHVHRSARTLTNSKPSRDTGDYFVNSLISNRLLQFVMRVLFFKQLAELLLFVLNINFPVLGKLKDATVTGHELNRRLTNVFTWPKQWTYVQNNNQNTHKSRAYYISCNNCLWMTVLDILLGVVISVLLFIYSSTVIQLVNNFHQFLTDRILISQIKWLMGWPSGLKLNENLDNFLGNVFLYYIDKWTVVVSTTVPFQDIILQVVLLLGSLGGLSMTMALLLDIFSFLTFHVTCFYLVSARTYAIQLNILSSLWRLFGGKKYNPLKQRIDSCDYDIDQLLLGTMLFTLAFFLFPTTAVYYIFFVGVKIMLTILRILTYFVVEALNNFPLFATYLTITDSDFLPGGIRFEICKKDEGMDQSGTHLILHNKPIELGHLLVVPINLMRNLVRTYHPLKCIKCLGTGSNINTA